MKLLKWLVIVALLYVAVVVLFESMLGYFQPQAGSTMVITTIAPDGTSHDRVVSRLESEGQVYVAVNHWPRAWYRRVRENPLIQVTYEGDSNDYRAVQLSGEDYDRVDSRHELGLVFRILTGFPRRHILRLDPA